jgi:serine/threonine-protein kinase
MPSQVISTTAEHEQSRFSERQEVLHLNTLYQRLFWPGLGGWLVFALLDVRLAMTLYPGTLARTFAIRAACALGLVFILRFVQRAESWGAIRLGLILMVLDVNVGVALIGAKVGGLSSPYHVGVIVLVAALGLTPARWQRLLPVMLVAVFAYPVALLGYLAFDPLVRARMFVPGALIDLESSVLVNVITGLLSLVGANLSWELRQQVFESRSIGRYELRRKLGAGGMGEVWAAWHKGLKREVALKILRAASRDGAQRFEREVQAMTELTHPHTVRVFDFGSTEDGILYYAMELLRGENLTSLVLREGALAPSRAVYFVTQAARALAEAHRRGMVHRDVKPDNLFVTQAGDEGDYLKVLDFGIVKRSEEPGAASLTQTGAIAGTPAYIAPEVVRGETIDARADVYALGGVLYFLLTGEGPFQGASAVALMMAHLHEPVRSPRELAKHDIPDDVEAIVLRCLAKDPGERYGHAGALADALDACSVAGTWTPRFQPTD